LAFYLQFLDIEYYSTAERGGVKVVRILFWRNSMESITKRILVVDDDQGILDSFEVLLGDRYDLIKAENGYEALRILDVDPPQLMFLDIKMPGLNGIDILKKLQGNEKHVEVVVITGSCQEGIEEEAKSLGVIDYLKKPLDIFEVERITSHVLQ
jgi:two-component system, response regulator, stage 0 sporulation protein F